MSSRREPAIDVQAVTQVSASDRARGAAERPVSDDRTLVAGGDDEAPSTADLAELEPGAVIARYRIVGRLGAGGMGVVYRAHDTQLDREVALKLLRLGEDGTEGRTRMLREAKAAAKIRHPNVVTVYDAGEVFGRVFIAMEVIDGVTLKAHFRGRKRAWREVIEIMLGAGEGLAAAHAAGLVHRDFKPDNVLVEVGGRVRVLDFGLARATVEVDGPTMRAPTPGPTAPQPGLPADTPPVLRTLTQTGTLVGTPAYMAPEQHMARPVDARTDQFAYCVTCFECLYGQRPFAGDTQAELTMNVIEGRLLPPPRDRSDAPPEIFAALQRGLAVHPADRYPSLAELLAELRAIVRRHEPRDRKTLLIAAGLMLPVLTGAALYVASERGGPGVIEEPVAVAREDVDDVAPPGVPGPGSVISLPPERPGITIANHTKIPVATVAELFGRVLPDEVEAVVGRDEGLRLVGKDATAWRGAAEQLLAALGDDLTRRPVNPLLTQLSTPDGACGVYLLEADELAALAPAIAELPGVKRSSASEALRVLLVLDGGAAQGAIAQLVKEARTPKYSGWCFVNDSMGDRRECFKTREQCEKEELIWYDDRRRCKGVK